MDARVFMIELPVFFATGTTALLTAGIAVVATIDPSIASIVSVCVGGAVTITMGWIAFKTVSKKVDEQKRVNDLTLQKTVVIEGHVNSKETKYLGDIAALQQEVRILRETLSDKKETAALLAQSVKQSKESG